MGERPRPSPPSDRHKYHAATLRYGRHAFPIPVSVAASGNPASPYARSTARRTPRSSTGNTSGRPSEKISSISAVHRPIPRTRVTRSTTASSGSDPSSASTSVPSSAFAAKSSSAASFSRERPVARSASGSAAASSAGTG